MLELVTGASLGCLAMIAVVVTKTYGKLSVSRAFLALLVATIGYVIHPVVFDEWRPLTTSMLTMIPALFWVFCQFAFSERPNLSWYWIAIAIYSSLFPIADLFDFGGKDMEVFKHTVLVDLPGFCEYLLIGAGFWTVILHWPSDLVESRRRLRGVVVALLGLTVLFNVMSVNFNLGGSIVQRFTVMFCLLGVGYHILTVPKGLLFGVTIERDDRVVAIEGEKAHKINLQLSSVNSLMSDGYYKKEKLTITQLSQDIDIPEYVVRKIINEHLGYRNFNDYVNQWRIDDAKRQLLNEPEKPIMNISLDLGYRTLSSFNRAFKERMQKTPSQYRQSNTL